ncbi:MAG TPA: MMPL family transporter, partial [Solirubrobacterales bacterium]|nr:MMPL family transporter [Solirubrobacterales bacterium]
DLPEIQTYERIQQQFPGDQIPATVAVEGSGAETAEVEAAVRELTAETGAGRLFPGPASVQSSRDGQVVRIDVPIAGDGTDERSRRAVAELRETIIPATVGAVSGAEANVTGLTAGNVDFNDGMAGRVPLVVAFVLAMAFVLLLVTFRSIVIPIKAIVLNLLSVGAAYGLVVWIFQEGHLESLLGFESSGAVASWLPMFLFVVLFGLSMDYHVFILSRVREAWASGMSTERAVASAIKSTAGVVSAAALVMVAVFSIFATLSMLEMKQFGVGLGAAILIDATIVRAFLLPASMKLLGDWNWYLPSWLEWLPERRAPGELPPDPELEATA